MEEKSRQLQACLKYFKSSSVYEKLFQKIRRKYESLGRFGGSVVLEKLSEDEKEKIGGFFGRDYRKQKTITISVEHFEKSLHNSRFAGCTVEEILTGYFGEQLVAKKEKLENEEKQKTDFFLNLLEQCDSLYVKEWIEQDTEKNNSFIKKQYKKYGENIREEIMMVNQVAKTFPSLSDTTELLPVFAAKNTGNPHYFDKGRKGEAFLSSYLKYRNQSHIDNWLSKAEVSQQIYASMGILRDPLSNSCLVYGVQGLKRNKKYHKGIEGFLEEKEPFSITLQITESLDALYAPKKHVYVIENPAVFAYCIQKYPNETFLCGNGQLRLAVLKTMDLFPVDTIFHYAGDYDPEGLQIAERLRERYGERVQFWNYIEANYMKYLSNVTISDSRLAILENIRNEELQGIKNLIKEEKKAVYQESMLECYQI